MLIYLEKKLINNEISSSIISNFKNSKVLVIDNYKNIFDRNISWNIEKSLILASVNNSILEAPFWYWHSWKWYFLKNSLNCIYDCKYCYLKWAFKTDIPVIFLNYDDIKSQIISLIKEVRNTWYKDIIWFYSSDYSDNLAIDDLTQFTKYFIPFFDQFENVKMEIRTKSTNIKNILLLEPSKNVEIAFSLNPSEIISKYELKTPSLDMRLKAINTLIDKWWNVWVRFIPLLEINNYKEIYESFLNYIQTKIDFNLIYSVFIWGLLYTKEDYNKMLKKEPHLDLLYKLNKDFNDEFYREDKAVREYFYKLFDSIITEKKCNRCLDN